MPIPLALFLALAGLSAAASACVIAGLDPLRFGLPAVALAVLALAYRPT